MQLYKFPWAAIPDVVEFHGYTFVAATDDEGVVVRWFPNGAPNLALTKTFKIGNRTQGFPRLTVYNRWVWLAYVNTAENVIMIAVFDEFGLLANYTLAHNPWGIFPLCWDNSIGGLLSFQINDNGVARLYQGLVDGEIKEVVGGPTAPDGLSHSVHGLVVLRREAADDVPGMIHPHYLTDGTVAGKGLNGGIKISRGSVGGTVLDGLYTGDPRIAPQGGGLYTVVYWSPKEIDNALTVVYNINFNDIIEQPPVVNVPFLGEKAVGTVFTTGRYGNFSNVPGNFEILFDNFNDMRIKRPVIAGTQAKNVPSNMLMGWWAASNDTQTLPQVLEEIRKKSYPRAFVYTDTRVFDTSIIPLLKADDVLMPQAYLDQGESLAGFEQRMTAECTRLAQYNQWDIVIMAGASDRGFISDLQLQHLMPIYNRLVRLPGVKGVCFFAYGRPTGIISHPSLEPWLKAFGDATSGLPDGLVPVDTPPVNVPQVTVVSWGKELTPTNYWKVEVVDGNNIGVGAVVEIDSSKLKVTLRNSAGEASTGALRKINIHT